MSALIDILIPRQNYELVLDRIGEILAVEFENQAVLNNYDMDEVSIYKERTVPCQPSELAMVNVSLFSDDFVEDTQAQSQGMVRYIIEVFTNSKTEGDVRGDTIAALRLHRILGVIRSILMDPRYKTLGFAPPSIGHRKVERIFFMAAPNQDANTTRIGRLEFLVKVPEVPANFVTPVALTENFSQVTLAETELGYQWIYRSY